MSSRKGKKAKKVCLGPCIAWTVVATSMSLSTWKDVTDVEAMPYGVVTIIEVKPLGSPKHHEPGFLGPDWRREGANVPDSAGLTLNLPWANEMSGSEAGEAIWNARQCKRWLGLSRRQASSL